MTEYINAVKAQLKDWKVAVLTLVLTVARILFGYAWITAGFEKATTWLSDGKLNSIGLVKGMVNNLAAAGHPDPLGITHWYGWVAKVLFVNTMPALTDVMVVIFEIGCGLFFLLGFKVFWAGLVALFMNLQFMAAGSYNNFGYIWTDLALAKFAKYAELIGVSGYFDFKKNKSAVQKSVNM